MMSVKQQFTIGGRSSLFFTVVAYTCKMFMSPLAAVGSGQRVGTPTVKSSVAKSSTIFDHFNKNVLRS